MKEPNQRNYIDNLHQPIRSQIFNLLDLKTLHKITAVSKRWKKDSEQLIPKLDESDKKFLNLIKKYGNNREHLTYKPYDNVKSKLIAKFITLIETPEHKIHPVDFIIQITAIKIMNLRTGEEPFAISKLFLKKLDELLNDYLKKVIKDFISQDKLVFKNKALVAKYNLNDQGYLFKENYGYSEFYVAVYNLWEELNIEKIGPKDIREEVIQYVHDVCKELYQESLQKPRMGIF